MKKRALFVGVDHYEDGIIEDLRHAVDDSEELAAVFKRFLDFERVEKLRNPAGKKDILRKVRELTEGLGKGDLFFFYFAGHGFRVKENHVLVCSEDAYGDLEDEYDGLPMVQLKKQARGPWDRMLVIDACQNDIRKTRGTDPGMSARDLALILEDRGGEDDRVGEGVQVVVTSCAEGQKALEVEEQGHGLFTSALLETVTEHAKSRTRLDMSGFRREMSERMELLARRYRLDGTQNPMFGMPGRCEIVLLEGMVPQAGDAPAAETVPIPGELCETCGRYQPLTKLFKCRKCGKWHCIEHQDRQTWLCGACTAAQRREAEASAWKAEEERQRREAEARRKLEEERARAEEDARRKVLEAEKRLAAERKRAEELAARAAEAEEARRRLEETARNAAARRASYTDEWTVRLVSVGPQKIALIKEVRHLTGLGLKEAKDLVEGAPMNVRENVSRDEAETIKRQLESVGARVEIVAGEEDDASLPAERGDGRHWGSRTDEWSVRLASTGPQKIAVIKELRALLGLGLKEAKDMAEGAPVDISANASRDEAEKIKRQLESVGARVEIVAGEEDDASLPAERGDGRHWGSRTDEWSVRLASTGPQKIAVIKELRALLGLGLKEAKDMAEGAPMDISANVSRDEAEKIKRQLESVGARVEIAASGKEFQGNGPQSERRASPDKPEAVTIVTGMAGRRIDARVGQAVARLACEASPRSEEQASRGTSPKPLLPLAGDEKRIQLPGGATMEMVWCPPGSFLMGSPSGLFEGEYFARSKDELRHWVMLTEGFWMAKTPVTQAQWKSVMGNNPSHFKGDNLPVENVNWADCREFCRKAGLALPTEAQWEYACRAGTTGPYAGTGRLEDMGWYGSNSGRQTHPVGWKQPNAWGLFDMHGNVCEWCADWYGDYPAGAMTDPKGAWSGSFRVERGGSWSFNADYCRSAKRYGLSPSRTNSNLGFRPVKVLP